MLFTAPLYVVCFRLTDCSICPQTSLLRKQGVACVERRRFATCAIQPWRMFIRFGSYRRAFALNFFPICPLRFVHCQFALCCARLTSVGTHVDQVTCDQVSITTWRNTVGMSSHCLWSNSEVIRPCVHVASFSLCSCRRGRTGGHWPFARPNHHQPEHDGRVRARPQVAARIEHELHGLPRGR